MEPEPKLETGPPALIEAIVQLLTPPACREHVLGDLQERYRGPGQYIADVVRSVPFLVASRIRRTTLVPLLASQGLCVLVNFVDRSLTSVMTALAAAASAATVLALRNAYRVRTPQWSQSPAMDALVAMPIALTVHQILTVAAGQEFRPMYDFVNATQSFLMLFALGVLWSPHVLDKPAIGRRLMYIVACLAWCTLLAAVAAALTGFATGLVVTLMTSSAVSLGTRLTFAWVIGRIWDVAPVAGALLAVFVCAAYPRCALVPARSR
jgi:hypothetical protein